MDHGNIFLATALMANNPMNHDGVTFFAAARRELMRLGINRDAFQRRRDSSADRITAAISLRDYDKESSSVSC